MEIVFRDFEQVKGDVSCWLRHKTPKAKLTSRNPAEQFGRLRRYKDFQADPAVCLIAFELRSLVENRLLYGGIQVIPVGDEGQAIPTNMAWDDSMTCFSSPILGTAMPQRIDRISGVYLDRLYEQIAFPILNALSDLHA